METPGLVSILQPARCGVRLRLVGAALASGALCGAALVAGLGLSPRRPPPTKPPVLVAVPVVVPVAAAPAVPAAPPPPTEVERMAISAENPRLVAAWSYSAIFLSTDGGQSFARVFTDAESIEDAAFDHRGTLLVVSHGRLGTLSPESDDPDRDLPRSRGGPWKEIGGFRDPDADDGVDDGEQLRLLVAGDRIGVVGIDPADRTRLLMARPDRRGEWHTAPLFKDSEYDSWDGIEIEWIEPAAAGQVRLIAQSWQSDACGYGMFHELSIDVARGSARVRRIGEEPPPRRSRTYGGQ